MIETPHARRRRPPRAGLLALQRDARADRRDARRPRRAGHRPAGRRHAHLHLHLHDGQLPARRRAGTACRSSSATGPTRSAASTVEGPMLVPGFESFVGQFPIPMRHGMTIGELARLFNEHFGIGADLEVVPMEGWRATCSPTRPALPWVMPVAQHPDARHAPSSIPARCSSKARCSRRAAARRGRSSSWARRGSTPSAFAAALNALGLPGVQLPARPSSSRRSRSTRRRLRRLPDPRDRPPALPAGAAGVAVIDEFRAARPDGVRVARRRPMSTSTSKMPIDILAGNASSARTSSAARIPRRWRSRGSRPSPSSSGCGSRIRLY